jgi:trimeric autotransporter adhesin
MLISVLALALSTFNCGGYGSNGGGSPSGTAPHIAGLSPDNTDAGGPDFTLTINGTGFGTNSIVYWNATSHGATYVTGSQLTTTIPASEIATSGTVPVYVRSGSMNSNTVNFTIN